MIEQFMEEKMKKIALFTRFNICNQGSVLQTLATQQILNEMGYDNVVVNYVNQCEKFPKIVFESLKHNTKWNSNFIKKLVYIVIKSFSVGISNLKFDRYRKKYLKISKSIKKEQIDKEFPFAEYILCAGSDQLWGPIINEELDSTYFLDFSNNIKFSFSSSIGREMNLPQEHIAYLAKFKFITVRENKTKKYLKEKNIKKCYEILDPTLLIGKNYWQQFVKKNQEREEYILCYSIHKNDEFENKIKEISKKYKLKVIRLTNSIEDIFLYGRLKLNSSPSDFISLIFNAKYIFTDSFHCTIFSLMFNKQFIVFAPDKTSLRITNILSKFNIEERIVSETNRLEEITKQIDYSNINSKLEEIRLNNLDLLKKEIGELYEDSL